MHFLFYQLKYKFNWVGRFALYLNKYNIMKKIKNLFCIMLVSMFAFNNVSAKSKVNSITVDYPLPIYCQGQMVDVISGPRKLHSVMHFNKAGALVWVKNKITGNKLEGADGLYSMNSISKVNNFTTGNIKSTSHTNIVGDSGRVYKYFITWELDPVTWKMEILKERLVCY
jgi:hypothetical protein